MPYEAPRPRKGARISARAVEADREAIRANEIRPASDESMDRSRNGTVIHRPAVDILRSCTIKTPSGGIPAREDEPDPDDGFTPGSAACERWKRNSLGVKVPTGQILLVYNDTDVEVGGDKIGEAIKIDGVWCIIVESCGGTG